MSESASVHEEIEADIWSWMRDFVATRNEFYGAKFAPCPFAQRALATRTVSVAVWRSGDVREFIREHALRLRDAEELTTLVMALPPRTEFAWGLTDYIEMLNTKLIPDDVFLNTGVAKTTTSRYPGSAGKPYFVVVANSLAAVLNGSATLQRTDYYQNWPRAHVEIVVERRARMASKYARTEEGDHR